MFAYYNRRHHARAAAGWASAFRAAVPVALVLLLTIGSLPCTGAAALTEQLDAMFAATYSADVPGAALRVQRGDEVLLRRGYGMTDLEMEAPITPEMIFRLGPVTKQFTAVAVLMLAAEGKLDLDTPLSRCLAGQAARLPARHRLALQ